MQNSSPPDNPAGRIIPEPVNPPEASEWSGEPRGLARIWEGLVRIGLGESALRIGTGLSSIILFLVVIWIMGNFYLEPSGEQAQPGALAAALPSATPILRPPPLSGFDFHSDSSGITRLAQLRTILPNHPRFEVFTYTVETGDSIFAIAEKFNLQPETILWGNRYTLGDNPHLITPGLELNILPVDGVYHRWSAGEGLNAVADYYDVSPDDIINYPGNYLSLENLGDLSDPNIEPGTMLVVPGGRREFSSWATPRITRSDPASAKILGKGFCGSVADGIIGGGGFVWPTTIRHISGYNYSPNTNHFGIDIGGKTGDPIFASDHGVVVYAGWNDWGYGEVVVIDHGNGWQTLYAHLSAIYVGCGQSVYQGSGIGAMGSTGRSTGPHLHFEMLHDSYGKVDPRSFLQ